MEVSPLLRHLGIGSDALWSLMSGGHPYPQQATVMEVGAHAPTQSLEALSRGFSVHVWEPAPPSYSRIKNRLKEWINNGTATVNQGGRGDGPRHSGKVVV